MNELVNSPSVKLLDSLNLANKVRGLVSKKIKISKRWL